MPNPPSGARRCPLNKHSIPDRFGGRSAAGGVAAGPWFSLSLRGSVEDRARPRVYRRAVSDAGERPLGRHVLRHAARHRRPATSPGRPQLREGQRRRRTGEGRAARAAWDGIRQQFLDCYRPGNKADDTAKADFERLEKSAQHVYDKNRDAAQQFLTDAWPDIKTHFEAVKRFDEGDVGEAGKEPAKTPRSRRSGAGRKCRSSAAR